MDLAAESAFDIRLASPKPAFIPFVQICAGGVAAGIIDGSGLLWIAILPQANEYPSYVVFTVMAALCYEVMATRSGCFDILALARGEWRVSRVMRCWAGAILACLVTLFVLKTSAEI